MTTVHDLKEIEINVSCNSRIRSVSRKSIDPHEIFLFINSLPHVKWHGQPRLPLDLRTAHVELDRLPHVKWHAQHRLPLPVGQSHFA